MRKKAQVTLFIIIGILIIALVGIGYYITSDTSRSELGVEETADVPQKVIPVKIFVDACLENTL